MTNQASLTSALAQHIAREIEQAGGWIGFDTYMAHALYAPGLGYYAHGSAKFGALPYTEQDGVRVAGSDFVTAPELTPLFGWTVAQQVAQALQVTGTQEVWEFGAGSGALALQVLQALKAQGVVLTRYTIVDISGSLRARQQATLAAFADQVRWVDALPDSLQGVVLGNEVLDAMPVKLLARVQRVWHERGVAVGAVAADGTPGFVWQDRPTDLRPPLAIAGDHDYLTEIHPQGESFVRTLGDKLVRGAVFLLDYGFPEAEYYHPQRHMGTVMCHKAHQTDGDPLADVGLKDITAHVNFTGVALAGNDAGLGVLGYCNQARFLMNCGLLGQMEVADLPTRVMAQKLIMEHEMGEFFKVIGFYKGEPWLALGFAHGDKTHTL
ncbi:SAM-dependent methyltransferase [Rhodoferax sp.]|uniref:class I SAM-dependent methyltransferase n=1 Tax=Rhodoferax sp. TaxID=50421 RepID=UPI00260E4EA1|nr:SAM-dependent methyltransferase [Rhodoferax sp.]MDD2925606.1 SAM-dependent methyltransferase [Rhodoferax sp.]